ncbi:hypothetical protein GOBAR_DD08431 [Gossypium barbadense]|nr:hypothetical protein GOBAR_DD08431 [Gossypium barbadense]
MYSSHAREFYPNGADYGVELTGGSRGHWFGSVGGPSECYDRRIMQNDVGHVVGPSAATYRLSYAGQSIGPVFGQNSGQFQVQFARQRFGPNAGQSVGHVFGQNNGLTVGQYIEPSTAQPNSIIVPSPTVPLPSDLGCNSDPGCNSHRSGTLQLPNMLHSRESVTVGCRLNVGII